MEISYIANARIPTEKAHGAQIVNMCASFARAGHDVTLIVPRRFNSIKEDPFAYYGVSKNFSIQKIWTIDLVQLGRVGFHLQEMLFSFATLFCVLFKKNGAVYSRDELPLVLLSFFRKNILWEVHMPRYNFFAQILTARARKIVSISQGLKDFYTEKGVASEKILVAHDGVDLEKFDVIESKSKARSALGIDLEKSTVMYIGRIDRWKGVHVLLEATKILKEIKVVVVGEGNLSDELEEKYPNVMFLGSRPYRDLPTNQQAADVLVIPNSGKSEVSRLYTSPLKVFAHMMSGIPVVASDLPSLREILSEETAILVDPDSPQKLAMGIQEALKMGEDILLKTRNARKAAQQYSWERRAEHIIEFIECHEKN